MERTYLPSDQSVLGPRPDWAIAFQSGESTPVAPAKEAEAVLARPAPLPTPHAHSAALAFFVSRAPGSHLFGTPTPAGNLRPVKRKGSARELNSPHASSSHELAGDGRVRGGIVSEAEREDMHRQSMLPQEAHALTGRVSAELNRLVASIERLSRVDPRQPATSDPGGETPPSLVALRDQVLSVQTAAGQLLTELPAARLAPEHRERLQQALLKLQEDVTRMLFLTQVAGMSPTPGQPGEAEGGETAPFSLAMLRWLDELGHDALRRLNALFGEAGGARTEEAYARAAVAPPSAVAASQAVPLAQRPMEVRGGGDKSIGYPVWTLVQAVLRQSEPLRTLQRIVAALRVQAPAILPLPGGGFPAALVPGGTWQLHLRL